MGYVGAQLSGRYCPARNYRFSLLSARYYQRAFVLRANDGLSAVLRTN